MNYNTYTHQAELSPNSIRCRQLLGEDSLECWSDWKWQLRNRIRSLGQFEAFFELTSSEKAALDRHRTDGGFSVAITPYYASLMDPSDPEDPLRKTKIPRLDEFETGPGEMEDPLGEDRHSPVPGIVHTYPDKVLFLVTDFCASYCRYCTRSRLVGSGELVPDRNRWEQGLAYIEQHKEIRDVLISGGDPLMLADARLEELLGRLRSIEHVELIRIGTKVPAVLPQRITQDLCDTLRRYHPLYMSLHFIHPAELTDTCAEACAKLADAGIPLGGQAVLLRGVNDKPETMKALMQGLVKIRVKPYYLHQCDAIAGSSHFKTSVQAGLELMRSLHGFTSGYAVPQYMVDASGGGGKVPLVPDYLERRDGEWLVFRNYAGEVYRYYDPTGDG